MYKKKKLQKIYAAPIQHLKDKGKYKDDQPI